MSATGTDTVSLNLDGSFATEAAKAAAAGEKLAGALGGVDAAASKAEASVKAAAEAARASFTSYTRSSALDEESPWAKAAEAQRKAMAKARQQAEADGYDPRKKAIREAKEYADAIKAARPGGGAKGGGGEDGAGGSPKDLKYLLKTAGIGKAAQAAVGAASSVELAKLAMGVRGMAMLQALGMRAQMQFRQLFRGVDPAPVIRAFDRFTQLVNGNTAAGKAMAGLFSRAFNGLFSAVEKVEPVLSAMVKMALIGAQGMEIAWLRARIALLPVTNALADAGIEIDGIGLAAQMAAAPFQVLGAYAETLGKFITFAYEAAVKLNGALGGIPSAVLSKVPDVARAYGDVYGKAGSALTAPLAGGAAAVRGLLGQPEPPAGSSPKPDAPGAKAAGYATGQAYPQGVAEGVASGQAAVDAAGAATLRGLNASARRAGKIQSPSKLAEETGAEYPAGLERGVQRGVGAVQAAGSALVPNMPGAGGGGAARGLGGALSVSITHLWQGERPKDHRAYEKAAEAGDLLAMRSIAQQLGVSVELVTP